MKVYNKKLAKRIADFEKRLVTIRKQTGPIGNDVAKLEQSLQACVNADIETLRIAGYDKHGVKLDRDFEFLKDVATGYLQTDMGRLGKDAFVRQCKDKEMASRAYDAALAALPVAKTTPEFSPEDDRPWVYSDNNTFRTLPPTRKQDQGVWFLITECEELVAGRWEGFVAVAPIRNKGAK